MNCQTMRLQRRGQSIRVRLWAAPQPTSNGHRKVLIVHGMGEHSARYGAVAAALNAANITVAALDLRGHGQSLPKDASVGDMGYQGWTECLRDIHRLQRWLDANYDGATILLGHSMGATLAQQYLYLHSADLAGVVLSGPVGAMPAATWLAFESIARFDAWRIHPGADSPLLSKRIFAANNRAFEKPGEDAGDGFAWLSRDPDQVAAYVADPLCGGVIKADNLADMFAASRRAVAPENLLCIRDGFPMYVLWGSADPISQGGGATRLIKIYTNAGLDVAQKCYVDGRHEMFNEINRETTIADLIRWLEQARFTL